MINIYAGFDPREEVGYHTFCSSVIHHASRPVSITPLVLRNLYGLEARDGTNEFIYSRFLIPFIEGYKGFSLFCDGADMIVKDDIAKLWDMRNHRMAVQVVKHDYSTRHPRKYIGTAMEADNRDYPRKNHSSVMLINCQHGAWRAVDADFIAQRTGADMHRFSWIPDEFIGELPVEWNWLVDEYGPNDEAKLLHWTCGIPAFPNYQNAPMADEWFKERSRVNYATT